MEIAIRQSVKEDFDHIFALFGQLWPGKELHEKDLIEVFDRGMQSDSDVYFCATSGSKVIGFCAMLIANNFWQEGQIAYVYAMIVEDAYRGKGIGKKLIEKAFETARDRKCKKIELDSGFQRELAHKFYEQMGFVKRAFLFSKDIKE